VVITTPPFLHVPMAKACAEKGLHFLVEKPLGVSLEECRDLARVCRERGVVSLVGYVSRYMETYRKGKEILESGALGQVDWVSATIAVSEKFRESDNWLYKKATAGGGVLIGLASHVIDLLVWYFGKPSRVGGIVRRAISKEVEDYAHATIQWGDAFGGWLEAGWSVYNRRLPQSEIVVHGRNGQLTIGRETLRVYLQEENGGYPAGWTELTKADLYRGVEFFIGGAEFTLEDREFIDAVQGKGKVAVDVFEALKTQEIVDGIYRAAETGRVQELAR